MDSLRRTSKSEDRDLPPFPYKLVRVSQSDAVHKCIELRKEGHGSFTPIILDSPDRYEESAKEQQSAPQEIEDTLQAAKEISVQEWFADRRSADPDYYTELEKGPWPAAPDQFELRIHLDSSDNFIAKVPTPNACDAIAYIGFGGWNDCPDDHEHIAILNYWQERYGARLIAISGDTLELTVDQPPTSQGDALQLAREQFLYCSGIASEHLSSPNDHIPGLAAALMKSNCWCFWWD